MKEKAQADSIVRSAGVVSAAVFASRITGLVREMALAAMFGAGQVFDAFRLGFLIPNLTRDLFAEGALSSAFVPTFTEYLSTKGKQEASVLANLVATALVIVVGSLCLLGMIFAPHLVNTVAPGFHEVPGKFELAVLLTRIMFPFLLVVALSAQAMGILNACNQFAVPALASSFFNIGSLLLGLLLGKWIGPSVGISEIVGMAWGVLLGGALQLIWQLPSLYRAGFRFSPLWQPAHPGLIRILQLMGPAILGNAAVQINTTVNTNFASRWDGAVSWLGYAFRFMQLPLGIFGVAIASATLPAISRAAAARDLDTFARTLLRSLSLVMLLTIPSSIGLAVLGESIVGAIYEVGQFNREDTRQTALALSCYSLGLAGYSALKVLSPAFYALGDSRTPMTVSLISILINYATAVTVIETTGLRHAGLALSTSAVAIFAGLCQFWLMTERVQLSASRLFETLCKILAASAGMGLVVWSTSFGIRNWLGTGKGARLADLAISIPIGIAVLYALLRLLRVAELDAAVQAIASPLQRRLQRR